jgi:DNA/RNA endonuclease YhcR with UshA esterase domain
MKFILRHLFTLVIGLGVLNGAQAQLLQWNTFGNLGTETTEPSVSNDPNLSAANLTLGPGITAAANANRFGGSGWFDTGNIPAGNTLSEAIAGNNYIQFVVAPNAGFSFTPTSFVFRWDRSGTGPSSVTLRSSADGFTADLGTLTGLISGGASTTTDRTITITGLTNLTTATTFRLYGYGATATGGTGGFDTNASGVNVQLNGTTTGGPTDVPPTVSSINPLNGATGVAANSNITLTFSEPVTTSGTWVTVTGSSSGARTPGSGLTVTGGPTTFTLDPTADFTLGEVVTVTVTAANVADQDGTPNNMAADFSSTFTVAPPAGTISAAKAQAFSSTVTVTGVVTVANQFGGQVFIQDATGGIGIFDNTTPFLNEDPALLIGRELTVTGTLSEFGRTGGTFPAGTPGTGLTQISPVTSYTIGAAVGVPTPKVVTMTGLTEADEAVLVQVNNVAIPERGLVIPNTSYNGVDATGSGVVRIANTTFSNLNILGQALPARSSAVVGVLGQFQGTYQVQPRQTGDIAGAGPAAPSFGSTPENETLDVITINSEWFGHPSNGPGGTTPGAADAQRIAMTTLLNNLQADVYMLQEVNNVAQFNTMVANMPGYAAQLVTACFSNRPASPTPAEIDEGQKLAFIYKTSVIVPDAAVNGGNPLCYLSGFSVPSDYPQPYGTSVADPTRFWASGRFPVVFVVDATVNSVTRKLHLINIHARANASGADALERYAMRRFDFNALHTQLAIDYPSANIIMAGDYNDDVDVTVSDNPLNGTTTLVDFMNDPTNYRTLSFPLSLDKWRSFSSRFNMIDHITVSNELFDNQLVKTELVVDGYSILPTTNFHGTVTDHLAVKARLSLADIPTWNGTAWSPAPPVANQNARINGNFNTSTHGSGLAPGNLSINSPATLTITDNNSFTVNGTLNYTGNITVQSGGSLVQAANTGFLGTTTGTFLAQRDIANKPGPGYNYISSPVTGATFNSIGTSPYPNNLFRYDPTQATAATRWVGLPGTTVLQPGVGYTFISNTGASTLNFTGQPNNSNIIAVLIGLVSNRFNLVGNPYPSPISLAQLFNDNNSSTTGISGTAWFWQDNNNNTGTGSYLALNAVSNPTAQVAVGQGFFVQANSNSGTLNFSNSLRAVGSPTFYRGEGSDLERFRLEVTSPIGRDELWVAFGPQFTTGFERGFDAEKLESAPTVSLSAVVGSERLAIAALPNARQGFELPLQLFARSSGSHTFTSTEVEGQTGQKLFLEDRQTGEFYYLQPGRSHALSVPAGTHRGRYFLRTANEVAGQSVQAGLSIQAYSFGRELFVNADGAAQVAVYDLLGNKVQQFASQSGRFKATVAVPAPGVYIVKVATASGTHEKRVWFE